MKKYGGENIAVFVLSLGKTKLWSQLRVPTGLPLGKNLYYPLNRMLF